MSTAHAESPTSRDFQGLILAEHPTTGTQYDDDDRDDDMPVRMRQPMREVDENTEGPEEFEGDDEDELGHPEDDDADGEAGEK
jgi:hypothetical protein